MVILNLVLIPSGDWMSETKEIGLRGDVFKLANLALATTTYHDSVVFYGSAAFQRVDIGLLATLKLISKLRFRWSIRVRR